MEETEKLATVLVVEDTDALLELIVTVLKSANFVVLQATCGPTALTVAAGHPGKLDLLLSDVYLPGMSGLQVAETIKQSRPETHVMLMSAFDVGPIIMLNYGCTFIEKPLAAKTLLEIIAGVLHAPNKSKDSYQCNSREASEAQG
jgi:two-component system, cell cycle sensor histidine kinase and response regulator CckA